MYVHKCTCLTAHFPILAREAAALFPVASFFAKDRAAQPLGVFLPRKTSTTTAKRTERLPATRVTPEELAAIKQKALDAGLSVSEYQRQALLEGRVVVRQNAIDRQTISALLAIGSGFRAVDRNINQITKKLHVHDHIDLHYLRELIAKHEAVLQDLEPFVMRLIDDS